MLQSSSDRQLQGDPDCWRHEVSINDTVPRSQGCFQMVWLPVVFSL